MPAKLSAIERQKYLEKFIIPNFKNMINQNIYSSLFDINGVNIMTTNKSAIECGYDNWKDIVGLSYNLMSPSLIIDTMGGAVGDNLEKILLSCKKIHKLLLLTVNEKMVINFVDLLPYKSMYQAFFETYIPIFHPNGEVVAVQSFSTKYTMLNFNELLLDKDNPTTRPNIKEFFASNNELPIKLPVRQHEILYLILQGIPQEYAAQILNIKRGTLARIISEQICPRFNIHGSNTKLLIKKAMAMGLQHYMPRSLWFPGIIILDPDVIKLVDQMDIPS